MPALNDRRDDIPLLIDHFNQQICEEYGAPPRKFSPDAMQALQSVNWTGNIRELRNVVERLIILCGDTIQQADVDQYVLPASAQKSAELKQLFQRFDSLDALQAYVEKSYKEYRGLVS